MRKMLANVQKAKMTKKRQKKLCQNFNIDCHECQKGQKMLKIN